MDPERWRRVEDLFHQALALEEPLRTRFLDEECAGDLDVRREVDHWLAADADAPAQLAAAVGNAVRSLHTSLSPGRRIGPYEIVGLVGEGGMGSVYRARRSDDVFHKDVAIKLVRGGANSHDLLRRFHRERRIVARLEHPNIARVLDGGSTDDGLPYLVMEYVDGQTLLDYAAEHALDAPSRLRLFVQVCEAVEYAHQNHVVHRDLKPGNILVDKHGRPRLLDFGIAKLLASGDSGAGRDSTLTVGDFAMLTPQYASPEHVMGRPITAASDVYSLGVILYELLTGLRAHRMSDDSPAAIVKAVCEDVVPRPSIAAAEAQQLGYGCPVTPETLKGDLDRIVLMALERDPQRRYGSARALADDVRGHLEQLPVAARARTDGRFVTFVGQNRAAVTACSLAVLAAAILAAGYLEILPDGRPARAPAGKVMLAVLPLENLTGSTDQEYFIDGLHEEIISRLGRLQPDRLAVIARTSMLQYRVTTKSIATIGRELGAHYILEGSVRSTGERVRVTSQLVQVSDQARVWADTFERELRDLFSVQTEIGARVADSLELEVLPEALAAVERHAQLSADVFAEYLRGRYYWQRRWLDYPSNLQRAVDHFEAVVALAPAYAEGHAALGQSWEFLSIYGTPTERQRLQDKARAALSKALAMDTTLASAHAALALIRFQDWDWPGAEHGFREALRQDPNSADAHQYLALLLAYTGRDEEADRESRLALELDPLSPTLHKLAFFVHVASRRWHLAQATVRRLSELVPADSAHVYFAALLAAFRGDCRGARDELAKRDPLPIGSGVTDEEYVAAYVLGRCADPLEAARYAKSMEARPQHYAHTIAVHYAGAGDRASALRWLEESFRRRESLLFFVAVDPTLDSLRSEPRFRTLLQNMNLAQR